MLSHPPPCNTDSGLFAKNAAGTPFSGKLDTIGLTGSCYCGRIMNRMKFLLLSFAWVCMAPLAGKDGAVSCPHAPAQAMHTHAACLLGS